jgi:hypothetical protein
MKPGCSVAVCSAKSHVKFFLRGVVVCFCAASLGLSVQAKGESPTNTSAPVVLNETNSFMGMLLGSEVRVKCTEPAVDLNHATLLALTPSNITVATATLDKFILPRDSTIVGAPVVWQATQTVIAPRSTPRVLVFALTGLLVAGAGAGVFVWLRRRRLEEELFQLPDLPDSSQPEKENESAESLVDV